jgi:hypothetical protein
LLLGVLATSFLGVWLLVQGSAKRAGPESQIREEPGAPTDTREELSPVPREREPALPDPASAPAPRPGRIVVRVRGASPGDTRVEVRDAAGAQVASLALTAARPTAGLDCQPGEFVLALDPDGTSALGALPQRIVLAPGATETVEFSLAATWRLAGRLADEREFGLEDVPIALERAERAVSAIRTRPDGAFLFPPLPEGEYALVVGDPLGPLLPRRILRLDGELGAQELRVPVLLELEVRVLDERGLAVPGAEVEGVGEKGGRIAGQTDADGRLRGTLLPPGDYRIYARHPSLGRGNRIFALSAPLPAPLEIRLLTRAPEH